MVDSEYITDNCNSSEISIGAKIKKPEVVKFAPEHFKTGKSVSMQLKIYLL